MKPVDRLRQAADDLTYVATHWHTFHRALADRTADGYSPGGEPGPRSTDVSDPTHGSVLARQRPTHTWDEATSLVIEAQGIAARLAKLMSSVGEQGDATPTRCSGGFAFDGGETWGDPTCTRHAVTRDGLCDACRQRRDHWRRKDAA